MYAFELQPNDTLFFKDARPMQAGAGSGGHGANWPLPTVLHEALRAELLRRAGDVPRQKQRTHVKHSREGVERKRPVVSDLFRSLRTLGPFPIRDGALYVPAPADLVPLPDGKAAVMAPIKDFSGVSNLPKPLKYPVGSKKNPGKRKIPEWISLAEFQAYLSAVDEVAFSPKPGLYGAEHRIGIAIDDATLAAAKHKLYAAEHLRCLGGTRLWVGADLSERDSKNNQGDDPLAGCVGQCLPLGGEARLARLMPSDLAEPFRDLPQPAGRLIKWTLVSPAVFSHGWRPNWVESDGKVMLKQGQIGRGANEERKAWRDRVRDLPAIDAALVAARVPSPIVFSGWDLALETADENGQNRPGGPKPTRLAVPASAVYYFEAATENDGAELVKALHGRTQSDFFGEKGMGLGFCGRWEWMKI